MVKSAYLSLAALIFAIGCAENDAQLKVEEYEGPMYELHNVETVYSTKRDDTSAVMTYKLIAEIQLVMDNQDMKFPQGFYIENYNVQGEVVFTIKGNEGFYDKKGNLYKATGDVVARNLEKDQTLNSEELYWKPGAGDESIYTDKYVIVKDPTNIWYGDGLRAPENFETYQLINPRGTVTIQE